MNVMRQSAGMVLMIGAVIGCAGEEEKTPPPAPPAPPARTVTSTPAPTTKEPAKGGMSAEMMPPPSPAASQPGASKTSEGTKTNAPPKVEGPTTGSTKPDSSAAGLSADELAAIKELPAAEQEQAIKQIVCPVSGHHLGEMGKPVKVTAEGRTFYLCCDDCQEKVKADPKGVIATLDKK
jgi:YHS domain-containing protein